MAQSEAKKKFPCEPAMRLPPPPVTVEQRLAVLRRALDERDILYSHKQQDNLKALIHLYTSKQIDVDCDLYLMRGVVVSKEKCDNPEATYFHEVSLIHAVLQNC